MHPAIRLFGLALVMLGAVSLTAFNSSHAKGNFSENVHYAELFTPVPVSTPADKVEVVEMFWYGCPHCYRLEPHVTAWKQTIADDVEVVRIPGVLNPKWGLHARAFYAAEAMGQVDKLHEAMFVAIHEQGRRLNSEDALVRFAVSQGFDGEKFKAAMNSMAANAKVKRATELGKQYQLTGVPALLVGGKYRVLSSGVRSYEEMFQVVDHLIDKVRSGG